MRGCHPTTDIYEKLRIYLGDEWQRQSNEHPNGKAVDVVFDVNTIPGVSLGVPQQTNSADCGVYLLHFAQLFVFSPFYDSGNSISRNEWFSPSDIAQKRMDIKALCIKLRREQGKCDLDVDAVIDRLQITYFKHSDDVNEQEDDFYDEEVEEEQDEDEANERLEFEDRVWDIEEDLLKDRLIAKSKCNPQFYQTLKGILDEIEDEQYPHQINNNFNM